MHTAQQGPISGAELRCILLLLLQRGLCRLQAMLLCLSLGYNPNMLQDTLDWNKSRQSRQQLLPAGDSAIDMGSPPPDCTHTYIRCIQAIVDTSL